MFLFGIEELATQMEEPFTIYPCKPFVTRLVTGAMKLYPGRMVTMVLLRGNRTKDTPMYTLKTWARRIYRLEFTMAMITTLLLSKPIMIQQDYLLPDHKKMTKLDGMVPSCF
jgi:hypothetical protein